MPQPIPNDGGTVIEVLPTTQSGTEVCVTLVHNKGRGYFIDARIWTTTPEGTRQTEVFGGFRQFKIADAARPSPKKARELAATVKAHPHYRLLLDTLLSKRGFTLAAAPAEPHPANA